MENVTVENETRRLQFKKESHEKFIYRYTFIFWGVFFFGSLPLKGFLFFFSKSDDG